ncbi:MAG TPA: hypothetical protein VLK34_06335, partial [Nocardioidaceae bacterium]|nr:hypothetical protein [Nocardioidaceae bacterium]
MSATIEDRLGAALEARAELVTSDDLRPLAVPDRPAHGRRRTVLVVSAAAAGVVAITAPFVIARLASSHPDGGPIGPLPTPPSATQASEQPTDAGDVIARQQADVDGDGRPDDVRVVVTARRGGGSEGVVEVTLASGDTGSA